MVTTVCHPEPLRWFSTPAGQRLQPAPDGGFIDSKGQELLSVRQILDRVYPDRVYPHSIPFSCQTNSLDPVVATACINHANAAFNPAFAASGPSGPSEEAPSAAALATIEPLIAHPFWQQLDVLAAPIPLRHRRLPLATTADLLVRFRNGGDIGIGICQSGQANFQRVASELGAAIALLGDTHSWWPRRAFVLFCYPGKTVVEVIDADTAVGAWLDALDIYRFMARSFRWEKPL
jgi:hypothetical protein